MPHADTGAAMMSVAAILSNKQNNRLLWLTGVQWALLQKSDFVFNY